MRDFVHDNLTHCNMLHRAVALFALQITRLRARGHASRPFALACESDCRSHSCTKHLTSDCTIAVYFGGIQFVRVSSILAWHTVIIPDNSGV